MYQEGASSRAVDHAMTKHVSLQRDAADTKQVHGCIIFSVNC